jgi:hypothetical protein
MCDALAALSGESCPQTGRDKEETVLRSLAHTKGKGKGNWPIGQVDGSERREGEATRSHRKARDKLSHAWQSQVACMHERGLNRERSQPSVIMSCSGQDMSIYECCQGHIIMSCNSGKLGDRTRFQVIIMCFEGRMSQML